MYIHDGGHIYSPTGTRCGQDMANSKVVRGAGWPSAGR